MNSIERTDLNDILRHLQDEIAEEHIQSLIDDPIDRIAEQYAFSYQPISTYSDFVETIACFIQRIFEQGILVKQNLSATQAKAEAFSLLCDYQGLHGRGADAAWIDARLQYNGDIEPILLQLKEIVKQKQRGRYVQWKLTQTLSRLDWQHKCALVKMLITNMKEHLPDAIRLCEPEQLVYQIPSLIDLHVNSSSQMQKILSKSFFS